MNGNLLLREVSLQMSDFFVQLARDNVDYIHTVFQELESRGIELPYPEYKDVYMILENLRDIIIPTIADKDTATQ